MCGNGITDVGEVCDDGNTIDGDGCSANCLSDETCGNGYLDTLVDEACDCGFGDVPIVQGCDGRQNSALGGLCNPDCQLHCGDGRVAPEEICDGGPPEGLYCTDFGFDMGDLGCATNCQTWSLDSCSNFNWTPMNSTIGRVIRGVWGSGPSDVYAVGESGSIVHYDGVSWSNISIPVPQHLLGVWGSGPDNVFVVATTGRIYHLTYQGDERIVEEFVVEPAAARTEPYLYGIWGNDANDVYVVGDHETIVHYNGSSWTVQNFDITGKRLRAVWGSGQTVYAVGEEGTILEKQGTSWVTMPSVPEANLRAVWGSGTDDVYAVGWSGTILHYDDLSWTEQESGTMELLFGVWGSGPDDVFAVGFDGTILHYDGNDHKVWSAIPSETSDSISTVWGSGPHDVFVAGSAGTILHHNGSSWAYARRARYVRRRAAPCSPWARARRRTCRSRSRSR